MAKKQTLPKGTRSAVLRRIMRYIRPHLPSLLLSLLLALVIVALTLYILLIEAALLYCFLHKIPVIIGYVQSFGQQLCQASSSCTVFPVDRDHRNLFFFHSLSLSYSRNCFTI